MTAILGLSAYYHDSAAALVVNGRLIAAAQEERFSRKKHDAAFPKEAIGCCLRQAELGIEDVDFVVFYEKPILKFERLLQTYRSAAPSGYGSFRRAIPVWLKEKIRLRARLRKELAGFRGRLVFAEHHESHAASAFFPSPFGEAAILTMDGVGEWATACLGVGKENAVELREEIRFPHSLGLLYSAFTAYCGFHVNNGEYKLMGLAPYGQPRFKKEILERLLDLKEDGSFRLDMNYFGYCHGLAMTTNKFHQLFGGPPRELDSEIDQRIKDLAASVQAVAEEVMLRVVHYVHARTGMRNLVLAGGVALNCVANGRIAREGPFENLWVQPSSGDAGAAVGAAQLVWHQLLENSREVNRDTREDGMQASLLGPEFSDEEVKECLQSSGATFTTCDSDDQLCDKVAGLLEQQNVVGWFQGRMEFSPRSLGARSILADPRSGEMQATLNQKIKFRESFRPFAPAVLKEHARDWFEMAGEDDRPYMTFVAPVVLSQKGEVPAVTHVDGSARVQTVDESRSPLFHRLLTQFFQQTGCPMLVNTSFNVRGEPIVCTPGDAVQCFMMSDMDALVMGRHVLLKAEQSRLPTDSERQSYRDTMRVATNDGRSMFADVDRNPTRRLLLQFGVMSVVASLVWSWFCGAGPTVMTGFVSVGFAVLALAFAVPEAVKLLYVGLQYVAAPLQWLVREAVLLAVFVGAFVPMGLWLRLRKQDVLEMKLDKKAGSYWVESKKKGAGSYYRQF